MSSTGIVRLLRPAAALLAVAAITACSTATASNGEPAGYGAGVTAEGDVLTGAQIEAINASRMTELFENRFAGVQVQNVGGNRILTIRGYPALIVIDGTPQGSDQGSLWSLRPSDAQEIRVLRDADTISYGPRGEHGVVLVTTRK